MKAFRIAILVLVLLMAVSLVNSAYLTRRCDEWTARLNAVTDAAGSGDWDTARQKVAALDNDWQAVLSPHDAAARGDQYSRHAAAAVRSVCGHPGYRLPVQRGPAAFAAMGPSGRDGAAEHQKRIVAFSRQQTLSQATVLWQKRLTAFLPKFFSHFSFKSLFSSDIKVLMSLNWR